MILKTPSDGFYHNLILNIFAEMGHDKEHHISTWLNQPNRSISHMYQPRYKEKICYHTGPGKSE
jgi:hypothetical protein